MPRGVSEYEFTKRGLIHSQRSVFQARQAFLDGDLAPLLQLLADPNLTAVDCPMFDVHFSIDLSKLLSDILTGKIKRPNRRPKKLKLTRNDTGLIGTRVEDYRRYSGMSRKGAIETVAEGSPAIEVMEGPEWQEIPAIPKTRVKQAYAAFQRMLREQEATTNKKTRKK